MHRLFCSASLKIDTSVNSVSPSALIEDSAANRNAPICLSENSEMVAQNQEGRPSLAPHAARIAQPLRLSRADADVLVLTALGEMRLSCDGHPHGILHDAVANGLQRRTAGGIAKDVHVRGTARLRIVWCDDCLAVQEEAPYVLTRVS